MKHIRVARPRICREYVKHGVTLDDLVRLTTLSNGALAIKSLSGNAAQRRKLRRQVIRALNSFDAGEWLTLVHTPRRTRSQWVGFPFTS